MVRSPVAHNDPVAPLMWVQVDVTRVDTPSSVQLSPPTFDVAYAVTPSCYNNGIHNGTIVSMLVVHSLHLDLICDTHGEVSHTIHALCSLSSYHHIIITCEYTNVVHMNCLISILYDPAIMMS